MDMPIVQITLDHMKHTIMQGFSVHIEDIKSKVSHLLEVVVRNFDFEAEVVKIAQPILRKVVEDVISWAIYEAVRKNRVIKNLLLEELKKAMEV